MIKIYHNPECGTSRNVLAVIKAAGYEVQVIEYLRVGWEREQLTYLLNAANLNPDKRFAQQSRMLPNLSYLMKQ